MKNQLGKISRNKDGFQVRFERILNHPIEQVWDAITQPEQLKYWFTDIEMDFKPGGKMKIRFRDEAKTLSEAEIISIDPLHKFSWSWEGEQAVFELIKIDFQKCKLVLTYSKLSEEYAVNAPAGFHSLLNRLEDTLNGSKVLYPFGTEINDRELLQTKLHYAQSVYSTYPEVIREKPIQVEKVYHAPVEKVWSALTDKDQMKQWYFELDDFKPEVGFKFQFPGQGLKGQEYIHLCKVTEVIPLQKLQYSWTYQGFEGYSIVTFELFKEGENTRVNLTHFGLDSFPTDNSDFAKENFKAGWNQIIGTMLSEFVEK